MDTQATQPQSAPVLVPLGSDEPIATQGQTQSTAPATLVSGTDTVNIPISTPSSPQPLPPATIPTEQKLTENLEQTISQPVATAPAQPATNQPIYLNPEEELLTSIGSLVITGHLTGEILEALLPGGIQYVDQVNGDTIGKYDAQSRQIILDKRVFVVVPKDERGEPLAGGLEGNPLEGFAHLLAHALLNQNKLLYTWEELSLLITQPHQEQTLKTLTPVEQRTIVRNYLQPEAQVRWETPHTANLIRSFATGQRDGGKWAHIVFELLAERLRAYLVSNATFSDFLEKRLARSSFIQDYIKSDKSKQQPDAETLTLTKELHDFARGLGDLQIPEAKTRIDTFFAEKFTTPHFLTIQQEFHDVVLETYVLFWRFSHILKGDQRQAQLLANLKSGSFYTPIPTEIASHLTEPDHILAALPGVATPRDKSLWQLIAEALSNLPK